MKTLSHNGQGLNQLTSENKSGTELEVLGNEGAVSPGVAMWFAFLFRIWGARGSNTGLETEVFVVFLRLSIQILGLYLETCHASVQIFSN
jgi:hypothetical protein